jgi:hypothetical protein
LHFLDGKTEREWKTREGKGNVIMICCNDERDNQFWERGREGGILKVLKGFINHLA